MPSDGLARPRIDPRKLAKFKKAFRLGDLTGKAAKIDARLPDEVSGALDDRIRGGDLRERAEINALLHYDRKETGGSTKESRVDSRTVIANVLGRGVGIGAATALRDLIDDLPPRKMKELADALNRDGVLAPNVLIEHLLDPKAADAPEQWNRLKGVVTGFPPVPERAGKTEISNPLVTMGRGDDGQLKVLNQAMSLLPFTVPDRNKNMSPQKLAAIGDIFDDVADAKYSRQGVAFECLGEFRRANGQRERRGQKKLPMKEVFAGVEVNGPQVVAKYGNGDCMTLAEEMVRQLNDQGIEAKLVGFQNSGLTRQRVGGDVKDPARAGLITDGMTHADVVIPYTDADGKERVITITPGMGKDPKWKKDLSREKFYAQSEAGNVVPSNRVLGPDGADIDTSKMQKDQLKFLTNLQLTNDKADGPSGDKKICGIDIMKGTIYLNGNASADFGGPRTAVDKAVSLDLKAMIGNPRARVTMKLWNTLTDAYDDVEMSNVEALVTTLTAIGKEFGQPDDFVDNILTLAENLDEYRRDVIAPEISSLHI